VRAQLAKPMNTPLRLVVEVKSLQRSGEGKELEEQGGEATAQVEDGPQGLRIGFPRDLLARAEGEEQAKAGDPKQLSPTLTGIGYLSLSKLRELMSPGPRLARLLARARLKSEANETWSGQPARLLKFELDPQKLAGKDAEYIKKQEASLELWVGADGTPLASRLRQAMSGRAFMVFTFETVMEQEQHYSRVGDRLVLLRSETRNLSSGTAGKQDQRVTHVLKPQA
jgi:hypothetical protein